jgi:hypothetical protein
MPNIDVSERENEVRICAELPGVKQACQGDPADATYPDKPKRMRWTTYNRIMDKLVAADRVADERLIMLAVRFGLAWNETSTEATDSEADGAIEGGPGRASGAD